MVLVISAFHAQPREQVGTKLFRPFTTPRTLPMQYECPRDSHTLMQQPAEDGTAWRCNVCSGAFFTGLISREVASKNVAIGPREVWDCEVACPNDGVRMQKVAVAPVAIDFCGRCSAAWLDGEEVERLFGTPEAEQLKAQPGDWAQADWFGPVVFAVVDSLLSGH